MLVYLFNHNVTYGTGFWENPPLTHKDKYLEMHDSIIQILKSCEGSKLHAYNLLQIYSYLIAIRLPTAQSTAS